jgi:anti-sigma regulatory factor (Ser/Thr protein kinase)
LESYLSLGAFAEAVPCARLHARLIVCEWGLNELAETVELLVSEIATNAVLASAQVDGSWFGGRRASGKPPVRLWLQSDGRSVVISVWDGNEGAPQVQEPLPDDEHGRGLLLVESLSEECGIYRLEGATGKVVWARVKSG